MHGYFRRLTPPVLLWLFSIGPQLFAGALVWEKSDAQVVVDGPDQASVRTDFAFRNAGSRSVTVVKLTTSCGCTTADLEKKTYAPGESGKVAVTVATGGHTGKQERFVTVATDEPPPDDTLAKLTVRLDIREYVSIEPRMVFWAPGDAGVEKTITCRAGTTRSVAIERLEAPYPDFAIRIEAVVPGREYLIHLKPVSNGNAAVVVLKLVTDVSGVGEKTFSIFATVK